MVFPWFSYTYVDVTPFPIDLGLARRPGVYRCGCQAPVLKDDESAEFR